MKKLFAFLLIASLLVFAACDNDENKPEVDKKTHGDFSTWNEWLEHKYGKEFGWNAKNGWDDPYAAITHNMLAEEYFFSKGLNAGWNLGNTYDWRANPRALQDDSRYDQLMAGIKAAGFNVLRLPVSWSTNNDNGSGGGGGNAAWNDTTKTLTLTQSWLDDVEAAALAAHKAGLVVFINTHHDKQFFRLDLAGLSLRDHGVTGADYVMYTERFKALWFQVAERFKEYGDWLMFESLNEPTVSDAHGGVIWDGAPYPAINQVLTKWNQVFIDAVRSAGDNNEKRYLIFKGYGGKLDPAITPGNSFTWPVDPAGEGRLAFSFHLYIPAGLALDGSSFNWTNANVYRNNYAKAQDAFALKGIPVFSGETSAIFQPARTGAESTEANKNRLMLLNAIGYYGRIYGIIPCLWDNAMIRQGDPAKNDENHGLFKRNNSLGTDRSKWGQPVDYTDRTMSWDNPGNAAWNDPQYGVTVINAFIDAVNGKSSLGNPTYSDKLKELMTEHNIAF